ncbi:methyltransferase domain-containing protein [Methylocystis suflitae]|uniref:methyltransferase domain-containing protein n=1 Tax=Methylocystis suflitae TaxID=2951405 RepID=UPI003899323B
MARGRTAGAAWARRRGIREPARKISPRGSRQRQRGVLEVGVGSGLNFPLYREQVEFVVGIDPSPRLLAMARRRAIAASVRAYLVLASAVAIPLADTTIDTVVMTWTHCSIANLDWVTRDATGSQAEWKARLYRTRPFARSRRRALAAPPHPHVAPYWGRLPSGPEDG